jgi:hypothetical protein
MSATGAVLETLTLVTPFGVRFWDVAAQKPAEPGLTVTAFPDSFPELVSSAIVSPSGIYSFAHLPGLGLVERGLGDEAFWTANPPSFPFTFNVADGQQRYLPLRFSTLLPVRGLFGLFSSPLITALTPDATWLPLFSAPSRSLPGPAAVIHAELVDDSLISPPSGSSAPAAWALVTAQFDGGQSISGLADRRGIISLVAPYPEPKNNPLQSSAMSPLGVGGAKLSNQTWPVSISVFYTPGNGGEDLPDLPTLLRQQAATAWLDSSHSARAADFTVHYGNDLILRSLDSASGRVLPVLLITSTGH